MRGSRVLGCVCIVAMASGCSPFMQRPHVDAQTDTVHCSIYAPVADTAGAALAGYVALELVSERISPDAELYDSTKWNVAWVYGIAGAAVVYAVSAAYGWSVYSRCSKLRQQVDADKRARPPGLTPAQ